MILIYSKDIDDFVNQVIDCLDKDFIRIGDHDHIVIDDIAVNDKTTSLKIRSDYFNSIDMESISSVWFNGGLANTVGSDYENHCYGMLINTYINYQSNNNIGRPLASFEVNKLDASLEAKKQCLKVPETILTNKKDHLIAFYNRHMRDNGIICKRITDQYLYETDEFTYDFNLTFKIDSKILDKIPEYFAISLFQERIVADHEIRVVYLKGQFYAMCVHTFDSVIDYRTKLRSLKNIRTTPFQLPNDIEVKLEKVFQKFDLNYGSADLMYSNGEFYFLEINPTGQVSFLNNACNYYIENELSKLLKYEA